MIRGFTIAFLLSFGPTVSDSFARFANALLLPSMREELALSYSQVGWLNTANAIGYLGGAILIWLLVRRHGNRLPWKRSLSGVLDFRTENRRVIASADWRIALSTTAGSVLQRVRPDAD